MGSWVQIAGDSYLVTGVDRRGKRFKIRCATWQHADCINVWQGTKWLLRNGKRIKIQSVCN